MVADEHILIRIELGQFLQTNEATWAPAAPSTRVLLEQCALLGNGVQYDNGHCRADVSILVGSGIHLVDRHSQLVVALLGNSRNVQGNSCRLAEEGIDSGIEMLCTRLTCYAIADVERLDAVGAVVGDGYGNVEGLARHHILRLALGYGCSVALDGIAC